jgi:hypothetical protein
MPPLKRYPENSAVQRYMLAQSIKIIVRELRKRMVILNPDEIVPRMLAVGKSRGTPDFENAVKDLLVALAKKVSSAGYCQEFEKYI